MAVNVFHLVTVYSHVVLCVNTNKSSKWLPIFWRNLVSPVPPPSGIALKMTAGGASNTLNTDWTMWCHNCLDYCISL